MPNISLCSFCYIACTGGAVSFCGRCRSRATVSSCFGPVAHVFWLHSCSFTRRCCCVCSRRRGDAGGRWRSRSDSQVAARSVCRESPDRAAAAVSVMTLLTVSPPPAFYYFSRSPFHSSGAFASCVTHADSVERDDVDRVEAAARVLRCCFGAGVAIA